MTALKRDKVVYIVSLVVTGVLVGLGLIAPDAFSSSTKDVFNFLIKHLGWWYLLVLNVFVLFLIFIAFSRFGKLKMGEADSKPEFSDIAWFGMLFGASMGVGLVFYGVGEPLYHYAAPPFGAAPGSAQAAQDAMRASFFHWGLHPWASYSAIAVCLAYFQFRKKAPGLMSSLLMPLLGSRGHRSILGRLVDILATFATTAGLATSIGLAVLQINSGLKYVFGLPQGAGPQLAILLTIGFVYTYTAVSGIARGIKFLGSLNLFLAFLLSALLLLFGPTLAQVEILLTTTGDYFQNLIIQSFDLAPYGGEYKGWLGGWTIFYWAWWIAWTPFVSAFLARISKGRTLRSFIGGSLLVPTFSCFCWFSIFGGTALNMQLTGTADITAAIKTDLASGIFVMYQSLPLGFLSGLMSAVMIVLVSTFLITSANAATFVLAMYTTEGNLNPPKTRMLVWGVLMAALAYVLLLTGGLSALQTASIVAAGPFSVIMILACYFLLRTLNRDFPPGAEIK